MKIGSIRSKVWIAIIGITLLTTLAMSVFFYQRSAKMIEENYITVFSERTRQLTDTVDEMLKNVCSTAIKASVDEEVREDLLAYLESGDEKNLSSLTSRLSAFLQKNSEISSMYLVIPGKKQVITTLDYPVYRSGISGDLLDDFMQNIEADSGPVLIPDLVDADKELLVFAQSVEDEEGNVIGYVCANLEERKLCYDYLENFGAGEAYLLKNEKILAAKELSLMGTDLEQAYTSWTKEDEAMGADQNTIYIYQEGDFSDCGILTCVERNVILSDLNRMRSYILGVLAVIVVLAMAVSSYIVRIVYRPISKLTGAMQKVSEGEIETRAEVISQDEIGAMAEEFNRMLDQIEELIARVIEEEQQKKDAELEALQYQITPHFMYNTLNSVKCYALIHQQKEIARVLDDFVELLQTCIRKKGAFLTVAEEMQILENYIRLQEFRNGEAYEVSWQVEPETRQCLVPRLILQPLLENSILHGMDIKKGTCALQIGAWTEDGRLYLKIADNGRGMSKEQIDALLHQQGKKTRGLTAVGIPNIVERLRLYYGEEAELRFEGSTEGTTAVIYLPIRRNGEDEG